MFLFRVSFKFCSGKYFCVQMLCKNGKRKTQLININQLRFCIVALEGFEPSQAEPESDVLPLHHKAIIC